MVIGKGKNNKNNARQEKNKRKNNQKEAREGKRTLLKKDPGLPNLRVLKSKLDHKSKMLQEKVERQQQYNRIKSKPEVMERINTMEYANLARMAEEASKRAYQFEEDHPLNNDLKIEHTKEDEAAEQTRRAFFKQLKQLVKKSDVIIEVLDARDPMGCRAINVERKILQKDPNKMIILVLNKIDLVPHEVVEQWLRRLRREFPAVAFKATTANRRSNVIQSDLKSLKAGNTLLTSSLAVGTDQLIQLLKNYSRNKSVKTAITVGIIGYPNVGKSSLINSLKRGRVVGVSAQPGFTKTLQEVQLDSKIQLIDCPGIIFDSNYNAQSKADKGGYLLRNCVDIQTIEDPETVVNEILVRCPSDFLSQYYNIPLYTTPTEFICYVAQRRGKLAKGGIPDKLSACRCVLYDWNTGKIPFYTLPPVDEDDIQNDASIVTSFSNELHLTDIYKEDENTISKLSVFNPNAKTNNNRKRYMILKPAQESSAGMDIDWDENEADQLNDQEIDKLLQYTFQKQTNLSREEQQGEQPTEEEMIRQSRGQMTIQANTPAIKKLINNNMNNNMNNKQMLTFQQQIDMSNAYQEQQRQMSENNDNEMNEEEETNNTMDMDQNIEYTGNYFMN